MGQAADTVPAAEVERRMEAFQEACRERGLAATHQRHVLYRALAGTTAHPSAEELFARVRRDMPSISLATVYKNLTTFRDEGFVRAVHTDDAVRFDANLDPHHHLECRVCGRVQDIHDPGLDGLKLPAKHAKGFRVESHQVVFRGVCRSCDADGGRRL